MSLLQFTDLVHERVSVTVVSTPSPTTTFSLDPVSGSVMVYSTVRGIRKVCVGSQSEPSMVSFSFYLRCTSSKTILTVIVYHVCEVLL